MPEDLFSLNICTQNRWEESFPAKISPISVPEEMETKIVTCSSMTDLSLIYILVFVFPC